MTKKYEPSDAELCDPKSPHFSPDWWKICEFDLSDPWGYIAADYQWSWGVLSDALKQVPEFDIQKIEFYPLEEVFAKDRVAYALSTVAQLQRDVEAMISSKHCDLEFAWKWGNYQKAIGLLMGSMPSVNKTEGLISYLRCISREKERARQWYALWFKWYQTKQNPKKVSRKIFDDYFEMILTDLRFKSRKIPKKYSKDIDSLIKNFSTSILDDAPVVLTNHFRQKKFHGTEFDETFDRAIKNQNTLPPVGEKNFPKK